MEETQTVETAKTEDAIEQLQRKLQEQIEALSKQRAAEAAHFEQEVAERNKLAEIERQERIKAHQKKEEEHRARRARELEEVEEKKREAIREQAKVEAAQNAALEAQRKLEEKLQWLNAEIAKQEFQEEQYRKRIESLKAKPEVTGTSTAEINVEHPIAPVNDKEPGGAVEGTDGLSVGPEMSAHLKHILRQATRA